MSKPIGWQPMSTAPRDGSVVLVCERWDTDGEYHAMAAAYMLGCGGANEGWWSVGRTSRMLPHLYSEGKQEKIDARKLPVGFRALVSCPICWMPLPAPEPYAKCRRREAALRQKR